MLSGFCGYIAYTVCVKNTIGGIYVHVHVCAICLTFGVAKLTVHKFPCSDDLGASVVA